MTTQRNHPGEFLLVSRGERRAENAAFSALGKRLVIVRGLVEALNTIQKRPTGCIVLSASFSDHECELFALEAERRGFPGPILRVFSKTESDVSTTRRPAEAEPAHALEISAFTQREQMVLSRVASGWTNQQIAFDLRCSEGSIKAVLQQIFDKLGVRKRAQVVRIAIESMLISPFATSDPTLAASHRLMKNPAILREDKQAD